MQVTDRMTYDKVQLTRWRLVKTDLHLSFFLSNWHFQPPIPCVHSRTRCEQNIHCVQKKWRQNSNDYNYGISHQN